MAGASVKMFGYDEAHQLLKKLPKLERANVARGLEKSAITMRDETKRTIRDGEADWPALKPATIKRKGSSKPLVDQGDLLNSITAHAEGLFVWFIGVLRCEKNPAQGENEDEDAPEMVDIALVHEFGSEDGTIPQRSFLNTTYNRLVGGCVKRVVDAIKAAKEGKRYAG